jgi:hypothetical protein
MGGARLPALAVLLSAAAALYWDGALPAPAPADAPVASFSAERAAVHLAALTAAGPRPAGSDAEAAAFEVRRRRRPRAAALRSSGAACR